MLLTANLAASSEAIFAISSKEYPHIIFFYWRSEYKEY